MSEISGRHPRTVRPPSPAMPRQWIIFPLRPCRKEVGRGQKSRIIPAFLSGGIQEVFRRRSLYLQGKICCLYELARIPLFSALMLFGNDCRNFIPIPGSSSDIPSERFIVGAVPFTHQLGKRLSASRRRPSRYCAQHFIILILRTAQAGLEYSLRKSIA